MQPLADFFAVQIADIRARLISATPAQRFTAKPRPADADAFHRVPAHRRDYVVRVRRDGTRRGGSESEHGTLSRYSSGCKCQPCKACNSAYGRQYRKVHTPNDRRVIRADKRFGITEGA